MKIFNYIRDQIPFAIGRTGVRASEILHYQGQSSSRAAQSGRNTGEVSLGGAAQGRAQEDHS